MSQVAHGRLTVVAQRPVAGGEAGDAAAPFYASTFEKTPAAAELARVGRALFFDRGLSASGNLACASCHDPARAFGPPDGVAVRRGRAQSAHEQARLPLLSPLEMANADVDSVVAKVQRGALPSELHARRRLAAIHGFWLRRHRRAAQP